MGELGTQLSKNSCNLACGLGECWGLLRDLLQGQLGHKTCFLRLLEAWCTGRGSSSLEDRGMKDGTTEDSVTRYKLLKVIATSLHLLMRICDPFAFDRCS